MLGSLVGLESSEQQIPARLRFVISWALKITLSTVCVSYITAQISTEGQVFIQLVEHLSLLSTEFVLLSIFLGVFLLCMNWGLEIIKWHALIGTYLSTRWSTSIKGVLSGLTIGVFTPNRIGEFIGRVLAIGPAKRVAATLLSVVNGLAQSVATISFGLFALAFLFDAIIGEELGGVGMVVLRLVLLLTWILALTIYFNLPLFANKISSWKLTVKWAEQLQLLGQISSAQLNRLYLLSLLRFMTFVGQYFLVFSFLLSEPNWLLIGGLSVVYLFSNTMLSFLPVPDILIRQMVALSYFSLFDFDLSIVSIAVFLVWLINVALPALVGVSALMTYRIFKSV